MSKIRTIITTDMEVDDMNSLIHLCLYLNEIDLLGVIYTSSQYHFNGDGVHTLGEVTPHYRTSGPAGLERPRTKFGPDPDGKNLKSFRPFPVGWIEDLWKNDYSKAYPYLKDNAEGFPTPEELLSITKYGNIEFEGDVRFDTEGSNMIKKYLLDDNEEPLYIQSWGGANTIVRALLSIYEEYKDSDEWNSIAKKVVDKARILGINKGVGQDNSWLDNKIPELYPGITTLWPENLYGTYMVFGALQPDIDPLFKAEWFKKYIHNGKSELMDSYHLMGDGRRVEGEAEVYQFGITSTLDFGFPNTEPVHFEKYSFIGEGDSNTYIPLFGMGLKGNKDYRFPTFLGRLHPNDETADTAYNIKTGRKEAFNPFVKAYQQDWAARARWCYETKEEANHAPVIKMDKTEFNVKAGETVEFNAEVTDPDNDNVYVSYESYPLYNRYKGEGFIRTWDVAKSATNFTVPEDAVNGDYFIFILRVEDDNKTSMTSFETIVVNVKD